MNELLELAIEAHGGLRRWAEISRFRVAASITGALWALKGKPGLLADVVLEGETRDQRLTISPFPWPDRYTTWEPFRQTIESHDGIIVAERRDPAASFTQLTIRSRWDDLQAAYFAGEESWNYVVVPFLFARADFVVDETEPWHEDGEVWRRLTVTYPSSIVAHTRRQTYSFDSRGLLRRLDCVVDLLGGSPAVVYPSDYHEFDGILVPTRRRAYLRNPDGTPRRESVYAAVDIAEAAFR